MTEHTVDAVRDALAALEDPKMRAVNERHGDDHGIKLSSLRALAKEIGRDHDLALALWATGETGPRLVALLVCHVTKFGADEIDRMVRDARVPKVTDWLISYVAKKTRHREELRTAWLDDGDPAVAAAGWALTAAKAGKPTEGLDLDALLDVIEAEMADAPERLQWEMNNTLAAIGIAHADRRERAIAIGERLRVLEDYPTPPGCTSPYAPTWIREIVSRQRA